MDQIPDNFYRLSIKALIFDDNNKFMMIKEDNGFWDFPGGALDFGESIKDCLRREISEEMGLTVTSIADNPSCFFTSLKKNGIWIANVFYKTTVVDLAFTPSNECVDIRFFTVDEALKESMFPSFAEFVKVYQP